ncbi:MAG: hypothetical protein ACK52I_29275 [Pseudomonadota bacterium]
MTIHFAYYIDGQDCEAIRVHKTELAAEEGRLDDMLATARDCGIKNPQLMDPADLWLELVEDHHIRISDVMRVKVRA